MSITASRIHTRRSQSPNKW